MRLLQVTTCMAAIYSLSWLDGHAVCEAILLSMDTVSIVLLKTTIEREKMVAR